MPKSKPTQSERVLQYIATFGSITQLDALQDLGVMRLASRISDLRKQGYHIVSSTEKVKNRFEETCCIKRYRFGAEKERKSNGRTPNVCENNN